MTTISRLVYGEIARTNRDACYRFADSGKFGPENREILWVRLTGLIRNSRELRDIRGAGVKVCIKIVILLLPNVTNKRMIR